VRFVTFFKESGVTTYDLLELGHGTYHFVENNQRGHFAVNTGG